jgi:hypothetical protein
VESSPPPEDEEAAYTSADDREKTSDSENSPNSGEVKKSGEGLSEQEQLPSSVTFEESVGSLGGEETVSSLIHEGNSST